NVLSIGDLKGGATYQVRVKIRRHLPALVVKDTTLSFSVDKDFCQVTIEKYFSPNGDGYNDYLSVANIQWYPNFELTIFNRLSQQVHSQSKDYKPWDGKWLGIDLP